MRISDDRRRAHGSADASCSTSRAACSSALAVGFWVLQIVQHDEVPGDGREQPPADAAAARAARRALRSRRPRPGREPRTRSTSRSCASRPRTSTARSGCWPAVLGIDEARVREIVDRHRREPSYRPITIVQDASLAQVAAVTARRLDLSCPTSSSQQVPTRRIPTDAWRRTCSATSARSARRSSGRRRRSRAATSSARPASRSVYNALLMGEDGARRVVVNSVGREIRTLEEVPPTEGQRLQLTIDDDVQKAVEDGVRGASGFNGAAVVLDPRNGEVLAFTSRAGLRPERVRGGHRSRDVGVARHRRAAAAAEPRAPGALLARIDVQDGGRRWRRSKKASSRPTSRCSAPAARPSTAATSSAGSKGGHGTSICATRSSSRATSTSTRVGNMLGVDKIHKWATLLGLGVKSGIDLPNEVQGLVPSTEWKQRADEREVVRRRDDLGRASARARCR